MADIKRIFNFLKDYNELSNPVITEMEKQKWSNKLSDLPQIKEIRSIYHHQDYNDLKILEIKRPTLEPCPAPDQLIIKWLDGNWKKLNIEDIQYKETLIIEKTNDDGNISQIEEFFNDDYNRINLYNEWSGRRNNWRTIELPKEQGLILYNNLFKLYSDMKKESESVELILGDGHIQWKTETRLIDHPVLLQKVQLLFDPEKPSFIVKCDELKTELYSAMLRNISSINQSMLSNIILEIEENEYHIADTLNIQGLLKRLINVIDDKGRYVESIQNSYYSPIIRTDPILFLRNRTLGFSTFIEKIIEEIENNPKITLPDFFENMVGNHKEHHEVVDGESWNENGIDKDILLTLPANNEQLKIIKYLNNYGAVLVQGPPGTGKTHTIANLIGHLLSQGNSVLVTSHTEKALTVLKEKVYKDPLINLQSLCIALLSSSSQKKEMDDAINEIASKSASLDLHESKKRIEKLEFERIELIENSKKKSQDLLHIRSLEYKDIVYANQTITPIDAAKFINLGIGIYDYIPGLTYDDTVSLPKPIDQLGDLYRSSQQVSLEEELLLGKELPSLASLWNVNDFKNKVENFIKYNEELLYWNPMLVLKTNYIDISEILDIASNIINGIASMEDFQLSIIEKTIQDSIYNNFWASIFSEFDILFEYYEEYRNIRFNNNYAITNKIITIESISILDEIIESQKEIPINLITMLTKPRWRKFRDEITNNGIIIEKNSDFINIRIIINYELQRLKIFNKINKLLLEVDDNKFTMDNFEEKVIQYRKKIQLSLNWYNDVWIKFINMLEDLCLFKEKFEEISNINIERPLESINSILMDIIVPDLKKGKIFELLKNLNNDWSILTKYLNDYKKCGQKIDEIIYAVTMKDINLYKKAYESLSNIILKKDIYNMRIQILNDLKIIAPDWANSISNRNGIHGECILPDNIDLAWKWRQLSNQIARIDNYDANSIQKELCKTNDQLLQNARKLAYEKAWYHKIKNKTVVQTQAIEGWRQTIRQIGKATGKSAPLLIKKARELMPLCQTAIPVWIMPLNRVAESFDPQKNKFDVVIIDEASQADILALSALYLGRRVIIVGDDEQVSPDSFGIKTEDINALIEQHLQGIPNNHLFNGKTSVYDMARASGFKPLMLTEHFRCLPEIIEFSNQLSYSGKIKPLRDASRVTIKPSVIEYRIPNAYRTERKINVVEAEYIASTICACIKNENYKGKTFGVISLLGQEQANEIDRLLQTNLDPIEYENRRIQCGTPPQFQGDERDIIFLSIVEGPSERGGPVRLLSEDGRFDMTRKRYNVAASRAKDQMWVVHSLNPEIDLQPDDIRLRLIKHAMNPSVDINKEKINTTESDFEKQVMVNLINQGYKTIPQWRVGAYRIDLVIEDGNNRVAIECDGEKWHTQDDFPNDLKRQAILERLGWRFIRIRGSAFYKNQKETMKWVCDELNGYDIKPNFCEDLCESHNNNKLIEDIKRDAEQIRRDWHIEDDISIDEKFEKTMVNIDAREFPSLEGEVTNQGLIIDENSIKEGKNKVQMKREVDFTIKSDHDLESDKNQLDINLIIKGELQGKCLSEEPIFDFRNISSKNGDQRSNTTRSKGTNISNSEKNDKVDSQRPLFDFRKSR